MKTDVQIAQEAKMKPIVEIAQNIGLEEDELELYGKYKAKVSLDVFERLKDKEDGKLVLVTAIQTIRAFLAAATPGILSSKTTQSLGLTLSRFAASK